MKINVRGLKLAGLAGITAGAVALAVALSGTALATPALTFVSEILSQTFFESIKVNAHADDDGTGAHKVRIVARDPSDVFVVRNTVAPGGYSGWHTHPGPSVVVVKRGTATVYEVEGTDCVQHTYPAGTGFVDAGGTHVHLVSNASATEILELYAFQIIPTGLARVISVTDPGLCPGL